MGPHVSDNSVWKNVRINSHASGLTLDILKMASWALIQYKDAILPV